MHRALLEEFLNISFGDSGQLDSLLRSLVPAVNTFAEWRWKTWAIVTKDMQRVRDAVVLATASLQSASELASGADGQAGVFLASVSDEQFWCRCAALRQLSTPFKEFSAWARGCECHEQARRTGPVKCPWAGCRAPQLRSRLESCL